MEKRIFTFSEASNLLDEVRVITQSASLRMASVRSQSVARPGSKRHHKVNEWCNRVIESWADQVTALGAHPKGLWTVDFDSGEGFFYCWELDEPRLAYMHGYEEGFSGRRPLSLKGGLNDDLPEDDFPKDGFPKD